MVANVTSLSGNGLRDWLVQRVSAVILGVYALFILIYLVMHPGIDFASWGNLFSNTGMRVFSFLALLSLVLHAWVGVWTIFTDYIKPYVLRLVLQVLLILALFSYLAWGSKILWGF